MKTLKQFQATSFVSAIISAVARPIKTGTGIGTSTDPNRNTKNLRKGRTTKYLINTLLAGLGTLLFAQAASAAMVTYVLHEGNNYRVELEPGVTISRGQGMRGPLAVSGGNWVIDGRNGGDPLTLSQLGGNRSQQPAGLTSSASLFRLVTDGQTEYRVRLLFWAQSGRGSISATAFDSVDLSGFSNPAVALQVSSSNIPLPASIGLFASGCLALLALRKLS